MRKLWLLAAAASLLLVARAPLAQAQDASVVASCGSITLPVGYAQAPVVQNTSGQLCTVASVTIASAVVTPTDKAGTLTTGGTAQTAIAANASRKGWCIQNPTTATEVLYVRSGTAATTATGVVLAAGAQACNPSGIIDQGIISVIAATTGHTWLGTEYQ